MVPLIFTTHSDQLETEDKRVDRLYIVQQRIQKYSICVASFQISFASAQQGPISGEVRECVMVTVVL